MAQTITHGFQQLVEAAKSEIEEISIAEAIKFVGSDDVVIVDLRDIRELQREGRIPGSVHCPRGMLRRMEESRRAPRSGRAEEEIAARSFRTSAGALSRL